MPDWLVEYGKMQKRGLECTYLEIELAKSLSRARITLDNAYVVIGDWLCGYGTESDLVDMCEELEVEFHRRAYSQHAPNYSRGILTSKSKQDEDI